MPIQENLIDLIPVGEANAAAARLLWQQIGMWQPPASNMNFTN
jgi:hypothetical protein